MKKISSKINQMICKFPAGIYLYKVNNGNARTIFEVCSKSTIKRLEQHQLHRSDVFIVDFVTHCSAVSIIDFELIITGWVKASSMSAFACSKLTKEALEQSLKYVQS